MKQAVHTEIKRGVHQMKYFIYGSLIKTETWSSKKHAYQYAFDKGYEINPIKISSNN